MGPTWGHLGPTGPRWAHVGPMNFAIWEYLTNNYQILFRVLAWCRQAISRYLNNVTSYGVTKPKWANVWFIIQQKAILSLKKTRGLENVKTMRSFNYPTSCLRTLKPSYQLFKRTPATDQTMVNLRPTAFGMGCMYAIHIAEYVWTSAFDNAFWATLLDNTVYVD